MQEKTRKDEENDHDWVWVEKGGEKWYGVALSTKCNR